MSTKKLPRQILNQEFAALKQQLLALNLEPGFAPEVIEANLQTIERRLGPVLRSFGVTRIYEYPVEYCTARYEEFEALVRTDGKKFWYARPGADWKDTFEYTNAEKQFIVSELCHCCASFPYWFYRYFFIQYFDGTIARPKEQIAGKIMMWILARINKLHLPVLIMNLKARQLGISTFHIGAILWRAQFRSGTHAILASAEEEKSIDLADKAWLALEKEPLWMQPVLTGEDRKRGPEFGIIKSDLQIQHGSMKKGMSRGSTPQAALVSEVAYYPNPIETIESSLMRAMHENPKTYLILESTARKKGDWYHKTWVSNREGEAEGYNRFTCVFLPWYVGRDIYPTDDWLRNHPVPAGWVPRKETLKQASDARLYVRTTEILAMFMGAGWEMPVEQQWFWEFNFLEASKDDQKLKSFLAEMASDERSCFQSKRWSVFRQEVIDRVEAHRSRKYVDYAVTGDGIGEKFALREFQSNAARRQEIFWTTMQGVPRSWRLVPLRETPKDDHLQMYLRVYELPKPGYDYTVAIDISGGVGSDATNVEVLRVGKPGEPDVEVAQLWSPWINSAELPPFALALGIFYGQHMSPIPQALMIPETQVAVGDPVSFQLAEEGYINFFYFDRYDTRKTAGHKSNRRGWATNAWSRPLMMEALKHGIDNEWVIINSERTQFDLENLESEELDSGKTKYEHAEGEHDDCYVSLAIAYFCSHDKETMTQRQKGNLKPKRKADISTMEEPETSSAEVMLSRHFQREDERFSGRYDESEEPDYVF